jgi:serine/threonine-protein kinase
VHFAAEGFTMIGRTISHYRIVEKLGQGGMGEVYLAHDTSLDRKVALKILPDIFSSDPERLARFEREAKLLASLNHPNIAAIYGLEQADGKRCLVMELVEGETLAERIAKGPMPLDAALETCSQIAQGMEAAHEKGIIHRDLKPANIKFTVEGKVKILDFGLAKAFQGEMLAGDSSKSPTLTDQMTGAGVILGTAAYMSPEQAKGKPVDKRADIWAFGCILYECLTGMRAFTGETVTETLAAVLRGEPDWNTLPDATPGITRFLLRQCLQRDPARRLRDIADARLQVAEGLSEEKPVAPPAQIANRSSLQSKMPWILAALGFALAGLSLILWGPWKPLTQNVTGQASLRLNIDLPSEAPLAPAGALPLTVGRPMMALSPDGSYLAYSALVGGRTRLFIRNMITAEFKTIAGSEDARNPFFSPDGQWLGFFSGTKLKKVSMRGGEPVALADITSLENGGVWSKDDQIYFNTDEQEGISRVAASGGPASPIAISRGYSYPEILPTGDLLAAYTGWRGIGVLNRKDPTAEPQVFLTNCNCPRYVSTGHLLYATPGKLMAIRFDLESMHTVGDPIIILDDLRTEGQGAAQFALSADGTLIYERGEHSDIGTFVWRDRRGNVKPVGLPRRYYDNFSLSHDGRKMAYLVHDMERADVYVYEFGGREIQLTVSGDNSYPIWSPDDKSIIFLTRKDGIRNTYQQTLEGIQSPVQLTQGKTDTSVAFFTPDAKQMLVGSFPYYRLVPALSPVGSISTEAPQIDLSQERMVGFIAIHPAGHYIAYNSKLYNRNEIFVRNFPSLDRKYPVSSGGGTEERWNPNGGKELIYRWELKWYSVDVKLQPKPEFSVPRVLFEGSYINVPGYSWDISPDGERFLLLEDQAVNKPVTQLVVITNFLEDLKRRLPPLKQ